MSALDPLVDRLRQLLCTSGGARRRDPRAYWRAYRKLSRLQPRGDTPIEEVEFIVLDTETTGPDYRRDRVISFAAIRVRHDSILIADAVDWRIRGRLPSKPASIEVHGLLNDALDAGLEEERFTELLVDYLRNTVLVGYHPGFDLAVLNRVVREQTGGKLTNRLLDVATLAMRVDFPIKEQLATRAPYELDALFERYHIECPGRHTAVGDAYSTSVLFLKLLTRLRANGVTTLGGLLRRYR